MATGETKLSYLDVVDDIKDGDTVPILRDGKNYMSTGLAQVNADLTDIQYGEVSFSSVPANSYQDVSVTFDKAFSKAPSITMTLRSSVTSSSYVTLQITVITQNAQGFTARVINSGTTTPSPNYCWIAVC